MINNKAQQMMTKQLACLVEQALVDEVQLSPKPGLVDARDNGAHTDMDASLFIKSARALTPFFEQMAQAAWCHPVDQTLRETIAQIGRSAEQAMFEATGGVNTHKGAIWVMGLLVSVYAHQISMRQSTQIETVLKKVSQLAQFLDEQYTSQNVTHGAVVKKRYRVNGAYEEAVLGYPHILLAVQTYQKWQTNTPQQAQLQMLLTLMGSVADTCVLHRSDQQTLIKMQQLAIQAGQNALPNDSFTALIQYCQEHHISPGGSADLLAASLFVLAVDAKISVC
ncbi:triphosphoribosyl-dephospho-CoA synthase MdcB [Latilactobacillus sakei]|uniref:triphosphoribosyl-dephospho-CoA synthase MdcB n=1 Tax=Latilactobacillus sakei TaxID=1599 RepID=UPI0020748580|nr:triphosphoribosyl-dephospho-CoA synthase MdcB [Latilactobacillus sakei]MDH0601407.1 triphosphoribosyl-dephospho-CoA synthase MdcB [Latilactobacillus sakei]USG02460.1 triphosphoribosyl-dephospho-CoA synthase MdcB [Latilactobacillus sakei]